MKCKRCGQCCENMALQVTPKELERYYRDWDNSVKNRTKVSYIYLLYPMLLPLGYDRKIKRWRYKCKHLIRKNGKAVCTIRKHRPASPCRSYGEENTDNKFNMAYNLEPRNKKLYPKCIF